MQVTSIILSKFISSPKTPNANQMLICLFPHITIKCGEPHGWWDDNPSDGVLVQILTKCGLGGTKSIIKHTRTLQLQNS